MPGGTSPPLGNMAVSQALYASLTPAASITGASSTTSTYTINGLVVGDLIDLYPQSVLTAQLSLGAIWVSATNVLSIQWVNAASGTSSSSPTAITCGIIVNRPQLIAYGVTSYPTALV
jgi:hypothetical protein